MKYLATIRQDDNLEFAVIEADDQKSALEKTISTFREAYPAYEISFLGEFQRRLGFGYVYVETHLHNDVLVEQFNNANEAQKQAYGWTKNALTIYLQEFQIDELYNIDFIPTSTEHN